MNSETMRPSSAQSGFHACLFLVAANPTHPTRAREVWSLEFTPEKEVIVVRHSREAVL